MKFVIFHGSLGYADSNWFPDLKAKLEYMDQTVICPQYPVDTVESIRKSPSYVTKQSLTSWFDTFENNVLPYLKKNEKLVFVGHSLGNLFILHCIEKYRIKLDCAIFVSPCLDRLSSVPWYYDKVNTTFYKTDFSYETLREYIPVSYVIYSDTDPYIEPHRALHFATVLHSSHIMVKRAGHLNAEVNVNEFPLVCELCVTRLDLTLYQKYLYRKRTEQSASNIIHSDRKVITIPAGEVNDEGRFHYMNLEKNGFATFISNAKDWNPEDEYFRAGRAARRQGIPITRVIIVKKPSDLHRKMLKKQIELDIAAGIEIRLLDVSALEEIGCPEDFGIWDNEFVCTLFREPGGHLLHGILDSRVKSVVTAQNWRDRIIRASRKISSAKEIETDELYSPVGFIASPRE